LNNLFGEPAVAVATNAEILEKILDIPILPELEEDMTELPASWSQIIEPIQ